MLLICGMLIVASLRVRISSRCMVPSLTLPRGQTPEAYDVVTHMGPGPSQVFAIILPMSQVFCPLSAIIDHRAEPRVTPTLTLAIITQDL